MSIGIFNIASDSLLAHPFAAGPFDIALFGVYMTP